MKKRLLFRVICCLAVAAAVIAAAIKLYVNNHAYDICRVEAGVSVTASDFLKKPDKNAVFTEDSEPFDINEPGEYQVKVKSGLFVYRSTLIIEDTIPPEADPADVSISYGDTCEASDFTDNITDVTKVTVSYVTEPDFSRIGSQSVEILMRDEGGNETRLDAQLYIVPVRLDVTVEAGSDPPTLEDFVLVDAEAEVLTDLEKMDLTLLVDYEVPVKVEEEIYTCTLHVVDTTPPELEVHNVEAYTLSGCPAKDFVTSSYDIQEVTFSFLQEPDFTLAGSQQVIIVAEDESGNTSQAQATLMLEDDTEAPMINGAEDLTIYAGESVSYKSKITVTDNAGDDNVTLSVDSSKVDLNTAGIYSVTYTATDMSGNTSTATVTVNVIEMDYTLEDVYEMADKILEQILTDDMTDRERARAIFNYVITHIVYVGTSDKTSWVIGAYVGFTQSRGDCFNFFACSKALLTRAGFETVDLERMGGTSRHYWQLVYVDGGWYHFDACPHSVSHDLDSFLLTESEVEAYNQLVPNYYVYDHDACPVTAVP